MGGGTPRPVKRRYARESTRPVTSCLIVALGLVGAFVAPAGAQRQVAREGVWVGFGIGVGVTAREPLSAFDEQGGGSGYARLGGSVTSRLLVGGEVAAWGRSENDVTLSRGNAVATVLVYPAPRSGFFFKGGLGLAVRILSAEAGGVTASSNETGLGSTLGLGFDLQVARNFFLVPGVDLLFQRISEGLANTGDSAVVILFTIGGTWH